MDFPINVGGVRLLLNGKMRSDSGNVFYKMGGATKIVIAIGFLTCASPGDMSHRIDQNTSTNWVSSAENEALTIVIIHLFISLCPVLRLCRFENKIVYFYHS